ncbi:hypothetical protein HMPREF2787_00435 [Corynebacterium sp. HMSC061H03]|nr:hypothetical protein HMPREF2787_00435 [Corynebacterium sp. HMSC061H03]
MREAARGGAGRKRRGAEAPIDQVQGQANRIQPGKGCAGVLEVRPWLLREVASRAAGPGWCLLLRFATCCCALLKQGSWFVVLSMHSSPIDSL